ncbi:MULTISPECIES: Nramp family divalent metal transporter [unclassified Novosphingobium]|uniref:Nramp family divalent metal transporter n=1 Tax=unclassified Novosphingobium TaxID=2644732 RepID=UPI0014415250|nr:MULTISPECIES: Nramp family divalent metal transporter [unclassified Novosphingobium]MBB3358945.1 manganese transport protein [Novosphingobium sp. BK256]MBB3375574.1 manganese transport protein [Novosphingobium sp. BK280]MBB3379717.1 manganese transport protein [Novosphingobium sp. BK258]MBB3421412.1 manganese transport protein [Novosphingobium sp. BK267]MBB3449727.1 manganese transport protein [Novosphingobium sp. BK352]
MSSLASLASRLSLPTTATAPFCPSEVRGTVAVAPQGPWWRVLWQAAGPGLLVAVGYMDPGNWATDIAAGSQFGHGLLFVVLACGLAAIVLQSLAMRVGLASGQDLAQLARRHYSPAACRALWLLAELAIIATDIAEVLGAALALHLLFRVPLWVGVLLTGLDTLIVLGLKGHGFRQLEAIVLGLIATITLCFGVQLAIVGVDGAALAAGAVPDLARLAQPGALVLAIGILGATVMPHNLYLHSSVVQTRLGDRSEQGTRRALRLAGADTVVSLLLATLVNVAILVLAAEAFHGHGHRDVGSIEDAWWLLAPITGAGLAPLLFGVALLAAGQSATFTGTVAGQVVLEGFLNLKIPCWQRRILTRALAIVPALAGVLWLGQGAVGKLLVATQVVLSLQLPFAIWPLLRFAGNRQVMGRFAASRLMLAIGWLLFALILAANLALVAGL